MHLRPAAILVVFLASLGCRPKVAAGRCLSDADCLAEGRICVQGQCQECSRDADCKPGLVCQASKCVPAGPSRSDAVASPVVAASDCEVQAVFFEFDRAILSDESRAVLQRNADCIAARAPNELEIAGHTDERGTEEYNLHLAQQRAESVKRYLRSLGRSSSPMRTISYGESRPADPRHAEGAWARNRRAELNLR